MGAYYAPGKYRCEVVEQAFMKSKTGRPMIVFSVKVLYQLEERYDDQGELDWATIQIDQQYSRTVRSGHRRGQSDGS